MNQNTAAEFRPELQIKVEEAMAADQNFIGDMIFPVFPISTRKVYWKQIRRGKGQLLANPGKTTADDPLKRAPGTAYREVTRTSEQKSALAVDRGLEEPVDDVNKQEESRFFDMESSVAMWLMRQIRIARETRIAAMVFDEDVWGAPVEAAEDFTEANLATLDFANLLKEAKRQVLKRQEMPNTLVVSREEWDIITSSQKLREYFFGTSGGNAMITKEMIAEKFELQQILIGNGSYDTTKPGKDSSDDNLVWTWGNKYMWLGQVTGGAPEMGGAGRTFVLDETTGGQLFVTESYREEKIRSTRIRVRQDEELGIVNECAGVLMQINELS